MTQAHPQVVIIGAGPAGLMAADVLSRAGVSVDVFDAMPSVGRKFLLAGRGGLNLTHAEPASVFVTRYGDRQDCLAPRLARFGAGEVIAWAHALGVDTFVGSSQRVFPTEMKAAPLLRAWLARIRAQGVRFHMRHRWLGWDEQGGLKFSVMRDSSLCGPSPKPDALILATGGASWSRLGSDGAWAPLLAQRGVAITPLQPANCGFDCGWSSLLSQRFAGAPIKPVVAHVRDEWGTSPPMQGEFVLTADGVEGQLVYALSARIRDALTRHDRSLRLVLDLAPGRSLERLAQALAMPRGRRSMANHVRVRAGLEGAKAALLRECTVRSAFDDPQRLAQAIKGLELPIRQARPIDEAISTAGGVAFEALDDQLMLKALPGTFCAGEMLDWEAPTGGYLLTACLSTGWAAAQGVLSRFKIQAEEERP